MTTFDTQVHHFFYLCLLINIQIEYAIGIHNAKFLEDAEYDALLVGLLELKSFSLRVHLVEARLGNDVA